MTTANNKKKDAQGSTQPAYNTPFRQRRIYTQEELDKLNEMIRLIQQKRAEDQKNVPK
jgi:hypothetical protein